MAGLLTFTLDPNMGTDFSVNNLAAKRFKIVHGYFDYDAASSSALTVTTAMVGLNDIRGFVAPGKDTIFSWTYDPNTDQIRPLAGFMASLTTSVVQYLNQTASMAVASITSIPFLCWGYE